jgi:F-type H+-transporting ATPase subunit b
VLAPPNFSLLLVMACFWLVFLLVATQLVKPLGRLLDERERRDREAREGLEAAQSRLEAAVDRCEREVAAAAVEAQRERTGLRGSGEAARRAKIDQARTQAQEHLARFDVELQQAAAQGRERLREHAGELARELASRLVGRSVA